MHVKLQTHLDIKQSKQRIATSGEKITLIPSFKFWGRKKFQYVMKNNTLYLERTVYGKYEPVFNGKFRTKNDYTILEGEIKPFLSSRVAKRIWVFSLILISVIILFSLSVDVLNLIQNREIPNRKGVVGIILLIILGYFMILSSIQYVQGFQKLTEKEIVEYLCKTLKAKIV